MPTHVKFTCVNEIKAMNERPRVNVIVEQGSTFTSADVCPMLTLGTRSGTMTPVKNDFTPFQTFSRLFQLVQSFEIWEIALE